MSIRIQIVENEKKPDEYAIAYDGEINGDDLFALLERTRKSERERIAIKLERIGIEMSKSKEYNLNNTAVRAHALYDVSSIIGGTSRHKCYFNATSSDCFQTWYHVQ